MKKNTINLIYVTLTLFCLTSSLFAQKKSAYAPTAVMSFHHLALQTEPVRISETKVRFLLDTRGVTSEDGTPIKHSLDIWHAYGIKVKLPNGEVHRIYGNVYGLTTDTHYLTLVEEAKKLKRDILLTKDMNYWNTSYFIFSLSESSKNQGFLIEDAKDKIGHNSREGRELTIQAVIEANSFLKKVGKIETTFQKSLVDLTPKLLSEPKFSEQNLILEELYMAMRNEARLAEADTETTKNTDSGKVFSGARSN